MSQKQPGTESPAAAAERGRPPSALIAAAQTSEISQI